MMSLSIYKITCKVNNKSYVGCTTKSLGARLYMHMSSKKNGFCTALYEDMRKYGDDNFFIELLEDCPDQETMRKRERHWIHELASMVPNGYNVSFRVLTDEQTAIVKFDALKLKRKEYAAMFHVSTTTIGCIQRGYHNHCAYDPYAYITQEHLPASLCVSFTT